MKEVEYMLESITIKGFRKYRNVQIGDFARINFIVGKNNIGKTTILEAIYSWACGQNIVPFFNIPLARARYSYIKNSYWMMEEILALVNDRHSLPLVFSLSGIDEGKKICLKHIIEPSDILTEFDSSYKNWENQIIPKNNDSTSPQSNQLAMPMFNTFTIAKWTVERDGNKQIYDITNQFSIFSNIKSYKTAKYIDFISHGSIQECAQIYSSLKRENKLNEVVAEIKTIFPEIVGFDMLPYPDGSQAPVSVIKKSGEILPLYACGDGVQRWFYILGAITIYKNSIICIDEIDSGFHPEAQKDFSKNLINYAEANNVQLFLTTHNIEFLDHFLDATDCMDERKKKNIKIVTVRNGENEIAVRSLDASRAKQARDEFRLELR